MGEPMKLPGLIQRMCVGLCGLTLAACAAESPPHALFESLEPYCEKAFGGQVVSEGRLSDAIKGKPAVIYLKSCSDDRIDLPLYLADEPAREIRLERRSAGLTLVIPSSEGDKGLVRLSSTDHQQSEAVFPAGDDEAIWSAEVTHGFEWREGAEALMYTIDNRAAEPVVFQFDMSTPISPPADSSVRR